MRDELLDTVTRLLAAAARGEGSWPRDATPRIRALSSRLTASGPGIDTVMDQIHALIRNQLESLTNGAGPTAHTAVRDVTTIGSQVLTDLLTGAHSSSERASHDVRTRSRSERARELLYGDDHALAEAYDLAPAYAVVATHGEAVDPARVRRAFDQAAGDGALAALGPTGGFVLVPAEDETRGFQLAERVHATLADRVWMSVSWRVTAETALGRREASKILSLVLAGDGDPGVYRIDDVLVEYAVVCEPSVRTRLRSIIGPLLDHPALFETLKVLIATDGNRSQAAERLIVHRSTLDYRIQRIEQLTGLRPGGVREINILSAAVAMHAMGTTGGPRPDAHHDS